MRPRKAAPIKSARSNRASDRATLVKTFVTGPAASQDPRSLFGELQVSWRCATQKAAQLSQERCSSRIIASASVVATVPLSRGYPRFVRGPGLVMCASFSVYSARGSVRSCGGLEERQ